MTSINMGVNTGLISMQCYSSAVSSSNFQSAVDFFFIYCQNLGMSQKYFWSCSWNKVGSGGLGILPSLFSCCIGQSWKDVFWKSTDPEV